MAYRLACESVVLLKNDGDVLPLARDARVALVGPLADERTLTGLWAFNADVAAIRTLREEVAQRAEGGLLHAKGCDVLDDYEVLGDMAKYLRIAERTDPDASRAEALEAARNADVVVVALGEHFMQSGEAASRTDLSLAKCQLDLLREMRGLGKPLVALVYSGRPLFLREVVENCDALLQVYWPGTEGSAAIADIIYGDVNPSGRLTMSVPECMGQIPVYYSHLRTGRPQVGSGHTGKFVSKYLDCPNDPLFPFGYGLSYTTFEVRDVRLSTETLRAGERLEVTVTLANTGCRDGDAVLQLYACDVAGSVARPVKELVDFRRVNVCAHCEATVSLEVGEEQLASYDARMRRVVEPGVFKLYVGLSSDECVEREFRFA